MLRYTRSFSWALALVGCVLLTLSACERSGDGESEETRNTAAEKEKEQTSDQKEPSSESTEAVASDDSTGGAESGAGFVDVAVDFKGFCARKSSGEVECGGYRLL